ncbi:hypothetical protein CKA32_005641 [Geitlerinema sp. FC II]|nr:hypothetical protein CKA32_005641 [Geitlerinema sp. FC II]
MCDRIFLNCLIRSYTVIQSPVISNRLKYPMTQAGNRSWGATAKAIA